MDERAAFIRAICAEPDEDTPRLAFADWLDEFGADVTCPHCRGEWVGRGRAKCPACRGAGLVPDGDRELAAFIRRGVALCAPECLAPGHDGDRAWAGWDGVIDAINQYPPRDPDHCPLCRAFRDQRNAQDTLGRRVAQEIAGWARLPADWSGRPDAGGQYLGVRFRGGFVREVSMPHAEFLADHFARRLFSSHPVARVRLSGCRPARWIGSNTRGIEGKWYWYDRGDLVSSWFGHHIPRELCPLAEGVRHDDVLMLQSAVFFDTEAEAAAALSRRCVAYGRRKADLPELAPRRAGGAGAH